MPGRHLSADDAAAFLGVSRQTLYAYVSRGLLVSEPGPGPSRARRYPIDVLERLRAERPRGGRREAGAKASLFWGPAVVDSSLTLIENGRLFYRGLDACELAGRAPFEDVAALLWTGSADPGDLFEDLPTPRSPARGPDIGTKIAGHLVDAAARPGPSLGSPRGGVLRTAAGLVTGMFHAAGARGRGPLAERLARGWGTAHGPDLDAALVLCADHELNVSAFTARCVASADASLDHVLIAALAALHGRRHGGSRVRVEGLLDRACRDGAGPTLDGALAEWGEIPGFGHPLYPDGDPRAVVLLDRAAAVAPTPGWLAELVDAAHGEYRLRPNLDLGLVWLVRALGVPADRAFGLFALGRSAGWVAHALEGWEDGRLLRPRARYVGERPQRTPGSGPTVGSPGPTNVARK